MGKYRFQRFASVKASKVYQVVRSLVARKMANKLTHQRLR
jgi:sugar-specific transcriptional regulator TrmB